MLLPTRILGDDREANVINGSAPPAANPALWTLCSHSCTATTLQARQMAYAHGATTANFHVGALALVLVASRQMPKKVVFFSCFSPEAEEVRIFFEPEEGAVTAMR